MMPPRPAPHRDGWTLTELLLVVAILAVLGALAAGAALRLFGSGEVVACANNLRQIGQAYGQYLRDHRDVWPPMISEDVPAAAFRMIREDTGLRMMPRRPAEGYGLPGPHWSIVLYPYLRAMDVYTCPADPNRDLRGLEVVGEKRRRAQALAGAPPESYALNVFLFRTSADMRRQAGVAWGTEGDVDFNGTRCSTTLAEQRRVFPALEQRILMFCGASGLTVGAQSNIPFRDGVVAGPAKGHPGPAERWEWHPRKASAPFVDEPGCGSVYLFFGGHVGYREDLPSRWEWGYELGDEP